MAWSETVHYDIEMVSMNNLHRIGNKNNYNMIHHVIIGGFIDVYIVVKFVLF